MVGSEEFRRSEGLAFRRISQMRKEAEGRAGDLADFPPFSDVDRAELDLSLGPSDRPEASSVMPTERSPV